MKFLQYTILVAILGFTAASFAQGVPFEGEQIIYSVKKLGVKGGEVTLNFQGLADLNGKPVYQLNFKATGPNFLDEEQIFMDSKTFVPLKVTRNLNIWGKKEKITEEYLADQGKVKITKEVDGKTTDQSIEKKGTLDNIYCFIYRYRLTGEFKLGDILSINLPTKDLKIKLEKMTKVKANGKVYESFYMKSDPSGYQLWFDKDEKIPVRINGAVGFGDTAMIMSDYRKGKEVSPQAPVTSPQTK